MRIETAPVVGVIAALPDGLDEPYWSGLAEGRLRMQRCQSCATWIWAPNWICPSCHRLHPDWVDVEPRGLIYSWTRTWHPFAVEFKDHVPYISVLVELPAAGNRRLLGLLIGDDHSDPTIGAEVVGVIQPASALTSNLPILRWSVAPAASGPATHSVDHTVAVPVPGGRS